MSPTLELTPVWYNLKTMNIFGLGLPELIVIALVLLLFFGKDRLPGLFRAIGTSIRELKDGLTSQETRPTPPQPDPTPPQSSTPPAPADNEPNELR